MVEILDCTLRDGSYTNGFQFTKSDTSSIVKKLEDSGVKYIEIGHGLGLGASRKGGQYRAAESDEAYLEAAASVITEANFGVFCIPGIAELEDLELAHSYGVQFIRIGVNVSEVQRSQKYIEKAKSLGIYTCSNYMKSYAVPPLEFLEKAKLSKSYGADLVYLVDSAGGMMPNEVEAYIKTVQDNLDIDLGYHGHDNLGLAISNSFLCAKLGVKLIDSSLQGLGRSAGNATTEQLVSVLKRNDFQTSIDLFKILDAGVSLKQRMNLNYKINPIDLIAGHALFHSSYLPVIKKFSEQYKVDPRELIVELCAVDQINASEDLVEEIAQKLNEVEESDFHARYSLKNYNINEQG